MRSSLARSLADFLVSSKKDLAVSLMPSPSCDRVPYYQVRINQLVDTYDMLALQRR